MMPLTLAAVGEENIIKKLIGNPDVKKHMEHLGFITGSRVTVIAANQGDVIVSVKESRIAISKAMANKIFV